MNAARRELGVFGARPANTPDRADPPCAWTNGRLNEWTWPRTESQPRESAAESLLLADPQTPDQVRIPIGILLLQVVQQPAALAHELQQATARVVVLRVRLEVLG